MSEQVGGPLDGLARGEIRGLVLAGGLARRMGGGDKALIEIGGRPILARVVARLGAQLAGGRAAIALSANGPPDRFGAFGLPVLSDPITAPDAATEPRLGPLAGVLAGLDWAREAGAAHLVTVAADTPFFPEDLVARLAAAAAPVGVAATEGAEGRLWPQPTFALWPVAAADDLRRALEGGTRKILAFADQMGWAAAAFAARQAGGAVYDPFFNVNTPADVTAAQEAARFWDAVGATSAAGATGATAAVRDRCGDTA